MPHLIVAAICPKHLLNRTDLDRLAEKKDVYPNGRKMQASGGFSLQLPSCVPVIGQELVAQAETIIMPLALRCW